MSFLKFVKKTTGYSNLLQKDWQAIRTLADDRFTVIVKVDKGSGSVGLDRMDYLRDRKTKKNKFLTKTCTKKFSIRYTCCLVRLILVTGLSPVLK